MTALIDNSPLSQLLMLGTFTYSSCRHRFLTNCDGV